MTPRSAPLEAVHDTLVLSEVFGPTVCGEGPSTGRTASFIRTGGCNLTCRWCTVPGMLILRPDFTWTPVEDLRVGDVVLGRTNPEQGKHGKLVESIVTHATRRNAPLIKVNGNLTCSADTRAWVSRNPNARMGWREFTRTEGLNCIFLAEPTKRDQAEYERGYLAGMADGDGCFWTLKTGGKKPYRRFRLAMNDQNLLDRTCEYAANAGFTLRPGTHTHTGFTGKGSVACLWLTKSAEADRFEQWVEEDLDSESWAWGYLGGIFDAEGSISGSSTIRIAQYPTSDDGVRVYERIAAAAERCAFTIARESEAVRLLTRGGEMWRFLVGATPAKRSALAKAIGRAPNNARQVVAVEDAGEGEVVSLTTSTGNYIVEGWLVHNCDSAFTWDGARFDLRAELTRVPVADVLRQVRDHRCSVAVITGGEPLLHQQQRGWRTLLDGLVDLGRRVEVETNGTVLPDAFTRERVDAFNVSPKLAFAGMAEDVRIRPPVVKAFLDTDRAIFKFVCRTAADVDAVDWLAGELGIPSHLVWIMPEGKTTEVLAVTTANIVDQALRYRFNITTRLHVLIWGNERGR